MVSYPRRIQLTERGAKMSRLTEKNITFAEKETLEMFRKERDHWQEFTVRMGKIENKLKKLEDLEEELGCPLDVFVKLHKQMKFYRLNALNEIIECEIDNPNDDEVYHIQADGIIFNQYDYGWQFYSFEDYKKTWWLKKDKSE